MSTKKSTSSELLYTKGTRVWISDKENVWQSAEVQKDYKEADIELVVQTEDGKDITIPIKAKENLPHLRNPDILIGQNDLTSLSYLHEPAVLYNLKYRFLNHGIIYTYCGIVLVAINPYEELEIYNAETVWAYRGQAMGDLDPHIFAVAEEAYTKMERDSRDQSIIVSGESGAGKTVSAKYAMRYFATVGGSENETQIEKKVIASSPIMEAIGNAKTTRNDNSSRFGKYVELHFDKKYSIMGASMRTYLLEKSRVVFQSDDERNYHIFYQICCAEHQEVSDLYLGSADSFLYTNQGGASKIKGVDDSETFLETLEALTLLGFGIDKRRNFFKVLAGILHLGNVQIHGGDDESSSIRKDDKHLTHLCDLLSLDFDSMRKWLCNRRIVTGKEEFIKAMSKAEAQNCRDALSKLLYAQVFNWVVEGINESLRTSGKWNRFIGVLDIYGFETFEFNSFEQFCINYANEKLQQQFNQHVFKLEQEEYVREGIEWTFIQFYDNQPCIDLIETKLGILDLLDEECRMPQGSDASWTLKLYNKCVKWADHFSKPRMNENAFNIHHFADKVEYQSMGFLEKNRDTVLQEQIFTVAESQNPFVSTILSDTTDHPPAKGQKPKVAVAAAATSSATATRKKTVGSQFRDSLTLLMSSLNATTPHYIRCIKPNDVKSSFQFDPARAVQQLRACGVLETIRISAAGFPSRWTYSDFFSRYRVLCHSREVKKDMRSNCERIVTRIIEEPDNYRFGKTKIFFRAGQVAYMEKIRLEKLRRCGLIIQKNIRTWYYLSRYRKLKRAALAIQTHGRGMLARRKALHLRQTAAATKIQKHFRRFVAQRKYQQLRRVVVGLQAVARGYLARERANYLTRVQKVEKIQRYWRGCLARRKRDKMLRNIVLVQCCIRRWLARRRFKSLKAEAKSLEHVRKLNHGLENKIIELQQKIGDLMKEINQNKHLKSEQVHLKTEKEANKALETQLKAIQLKMVEIEKSKQVAELNLKKELDEKVDLVTAKTRLESDFVQLTGEKDKLAANLAEALEQISKLEKRNEKLEIIRLEKTELEKEMDDQTVQYQIMVKRINDLEQQLHQQQKNPIPLPRKTTPSSATPSINSLDSSGVESLQEDVGLILALQQRLKDSEDEKERLAKMVELKENESPASEKRRAHDSLRLQELEMENAKLTANLKSLRESIEGNNGPAELKKQFEYLQEELSRKKEESIQLRSVLASKQPNQEPLSGDDEHEIGLILQTQKTVIQQLEKELQDEKSIKSSMEKNYRSEITKLKEELATVFTHLKSPQNKNELLLQHQIQRLTTDNLNLRAKIDDLQQQLHRLPALEQLESIPSSGPVIHKMKRNYTGMLQYQDEVKLTKILIIDLKPKIAMSALPGLPAYIIFMCIRYTDNLNDDDKVRKLLTCVIQNVKKVINKKGNSDFEISVLWLGNVLRLLHTLKQYSGDPSFQRENTSIQNEQALKNFDLSEYRQVLSDVAVWIYIMVIKQLEDRIQPLIVPAILETDTGLASQAIGIGAGHRSSRSSVSALQKPLEMLTGELDAMHAQLCSFGVDPEVISQVLRQLYYYLCAGALNNLLLRRDLCNWAKGLQIRYNVSVLEEWSRKKKLGSKEVLQTLNPIIQASQLLQARKGEGDVASISEMCDTLTIPQVVKLLNLYTTDEYENKLTPAFIAKVKAHLISTRKEEDTTNVLMDTKYSFAVKFPFNPSSIRLEDLEVPATFGMEGIVKRV